MERNLLEKYKLVSLLKMVAPPYLDGHQRDHSRDEQSLCPPVISLYPESVGVPGVVAGGDLEQQRPRLLGVEGDIVAIHLHPVPAYTSSGQSSREY